MFSPKDLNRGFPNTRAELHCSRPVPSNVSTGPHPRQVVEGPREVVLHRRSCAPPMARARLDAPEPWSWPRRRLRNRGQAMVHLALPEAAVAYNSSDGPACTGATPSSPPSTVVESNGTCRVTTMGTCSPRADLSVEVFNFLHIFWRARLGVVSLDAGESLRDLSPLTQASRNGWFMQLNSAGVSKPAHTLTPNCLLGA